MEVLNMKSIAVKYDEGMSDAAILRKCADVLDHVNRKHHGEVRVRDFKFERNVYTVSMEIETVGYVPSHDEVRSELERDMDRMFHQMFGDVITK